MIELERYRIIIMKYHQFKSGNYQRVCHLKTSSMETKIFCHFNKRQKRVLDETENKKVSQINVGCASLQGLMQPKTLREQFVI